MIRVLVVDDRNTVRQVLQSYLEIEPDIEIVGFALNGQAAIEQIETLQPDVILMDLEMPVLDGLSATKIIVDRFVNVKVVILTVYDDERYLTSALQAGAKGYLLKTTPGAELATAIRYVCQGYFQISPNLLEKYISKVSTRSLSLEGITEFERRLARQEKKIEKLNGYLSQKRLKLDRKLEEEIEKVVKENIFLASQDGKIEFKVDTLNKKLYVLEQKYSFLTKFTWIYTLIITTINLIVIGLLLK